ncbi:hypothetical protein EDB92DRAFT_1043175 [Lactarius akahatsu]|uniref:Secreted protein n=1 Tax=Lactarius akahatsu TaxID=416441 RepID=A0AAD4L440_9AGAM|nr:hypothetical protein EDB92DRAFT_1043175 [Lactarius akahatsu]
MIPSGAYVSAVRLFLSMFIAQFFCWPWKLCQPCVQHGHLSEPQTVHKCKPRGERDLPTASKLNRFLRAEDIGKPGVWHSDYAYHFTSFNAAYGTGLGGYP